MEGKMWLYSGLIVVVLALMGVGIWLVSTPQDKVEIPDEDPVVLMDINNPGTATISQLSLYEDGTIIYVEEAYSADFPVSAGDTYTRTWRTGSVSQANLNDFYDYLDSVEFNDIEGAYVPDEVYDQMGSENETDINKLKSYGPGFVPGGQSDYIRIDVDNGMIDNTIVAIGYLESDDTPYSELPYPVDFIYEELDYFVDIGTKEAMVEELTK